MTLRLLYQHYNDENRLHEQLITECIDIHGDDFIYVPRTFVAKDEILGEDRLSQFKNAHSIIMYLESVDGYEGQGALMSKFGLNMDQSAKLVVQKRTWDGAVGEEDTTILPNRPAEGDLVFYPRTNALFEIMFVDNEQPFYQLGQGYVYKLTVEKFRYSSEQIQTGVDEIDLMHDNLNTKTNPELPQKFGNNSKLKAKASEFIFNANNPFGSI